MYLEDTTTNTLSIRTYKKKWPGGPEQSNPEFNTELKALMALWMTHPVNPSNITPKVTMWNHICMDYVHSTHPTVTVCVPLNGNKLPPAMLAAANCKDQTISCTIPHLISGHYFGADYTICFCLNAGNHLICLYKHIPQWRPTRLCHQYPHTRDHVIFHCYLMLPHQWKHLEGLTTWHTIVTSQEATEHLCKFLWDSNSSLLRPLPAVGLAQP
jgi:hypothetical protein